MDKKKELEQIEKVLELPDATIKHSIVMDSYKSFKRIVIEYDNQKTR